MAVCCNDDGSIIPSGGRAECAVAGGTWHADRDTCPQRLCAFLGALNRYLQERTECDPVANLAATGTFASLYELRDDVLARSSVGQQLIDYYDRYADEAMTIIRSDPEALRESLRCFLLAAMFGQDLIRVLHGTASETVRQRIYSREAYEIALAATSRFRELAGDSAADFEEPLAFIEREISPLVETPAPEVLRRLLDDARRSGS